MTKASTENASTSASAACTATQGRNCWKPTDLTDEGLGRPQSGWSCRKRVRTGASSKTTTSSCRPLSLSMRTLRLSPSRLRGLSSTPQRAALRGHNTMRLVVIATSWCGVMARQSHQSNTAECSRALLRITAGRRKQNQGRACRTKGHKDDTIGLASLPRR